MDPTKLPPTHNMPESPAGVYFCLYATDGMHRIACPYGMGGAMLQAAKWLRQQRGGIKIQVWAGPPENPRSHLVATLYPEHRAEPWECPRCGSDCAGECSTTNWDRHNY